MNKYPDLEQLMEEYEAAQTEQNELGRFHEFSVGGSGWCATCARNA